MKFTSVFEFALELVTLAIGVWVVFMLGIVGRDVALAMMAANVYWMIRLALARKSWLAGQSVGLLAQAEGGCKTAVRRASRDWGARV